VKKNRAQNQLHFWTKNGIKGDSLAFLPVKKRTETVDNKDNKKVVFRLSAAEDRFAKRTHFDKVFF